MTRTGIYVCGALAFAAALAWRPAPALAHAFPTGSTPAVGSTVKSPPSKVVIHFDNPIEKLFARLQVLDGSGRNEDKSPPAVGADRRTLSVALKPLGPGNYTVKWSVVAEDGHRTEGSFIFTVAGAASG